MPLGDFWDAVLFGARPGTMATPASIEENVHFRQSVDWL